jgi:predicted outer membrane protein
VNVSIPTTLDSEQQQKLGLLQKLSGKQFDKAFRDYFRHRGLNAENALERTRSAGNLD